MERHLNDTEVRLRYGLAQFDVVLAREDIGQATKAAWYVVLKLSEFRFRQRLSLAPANVASPLGLSSKRGLDYIKELKLSGLLHVFDEPDGKSRLPGANRWDCCLLDPTLDRDEQLQLIAADPQTTLPFAGDEDHVADDAAGRNGNRQACTTSNVVLFTRPGQEAQPLVEAQRGRRDAMPSGPPEPAAELAPTSPQVIPEPPHVSLNTSSRLNQSSTSYFSGTSAPPTKLQVNTREGSCGGNGANSAGPRQREPTAIGGVEVGTGLLARALAVDPIERLAKIGKLADWLRNKTLDIVRDPVNRLDPELAHRVAAAIVDGDLPLKKVEAIFHNADRRAKNNDLKSRLGFSIGGFREVFRHARLDWRTGHKHPD
ncbi:MAG: hypothetical protein K8U03_09155 [Planctomycetia bacterium]|nr:hypothetical protein [Planctomycetia bacterium]